jgi:tRNA(Arg) A34 adenosine deaminase TadA
MVQVTQDVFDELYRLAQIAAEGHNLPSAAALLDPSGKIIVALPSRVASDKHALAHADLQVINEGCRILGSISLRGCTVVSVFEPSLMTISACYWASVSDIAFVVPAKPFVQQIPWASEGISIEEKTKIAAKFLEPVMLRNLDNNDGRFEKLCREYVASIVPKA